jgi:hypothetical protein
MVTLIYPRGWSFGATDNVVKIEKQIHRLDRDIYIQARTYSEGPGNGGIDRFINGMRKGFSVQDILDGLFDAIIDTDERNRPTELVPLPPLEELVKQNSDIKRINDGYLSIEDIAKDKDVSVATVKRWRNDGRVKKVK